VGVVDQQNRSRRWALAVVGTLVIGCLISGCSLFGGDSQADGTLQTAKVGQTQVTARVTDGTVAGAELTPLQGRSQPSRRWHRR
jgi:hypothetical protein